jgi:glycosyltransferase involved in cell wall biosynthesis
MIKKNISCVIPAYNEEKNISKVLEVVTTYNNFFEIIIIDDASKDNTYKIIKKFQKQNNKIKIIKNKINLGKSGSIKKGIYKSKGTIIVMLDADLVNLTHKNINSLIEPIITKKANQTILDRAGDRIPIWGWTNCAKYFGGERSLLKKDFLDAKISSDGGYLLEINLNLHFIHREKIIQTIFCNNLYTIHQYNKVSKIQGIKNYLKMSKQIVEKSGTYNFIKQIMYIEDSRYLLLYKIYKRYIYFRLFSGIIIVITNLIDGIFMSVWLNLKNIDIIPDKWAIAYQKRLTYLKNWYHNKKLYFKQR